MEAAGVICEYNPFHAGHQHHLAQTRRITGCGAVVCVMSGNFVQRGEPAILSKTARAEAAIRCGADLVLELPLAWALSSAENFAYGGAALLAASGVCRWLSYGSETGDAQAAQRVAEALVSVQADEEIRRELAGGIPYAAARQRAAEALAGADAEILLKPNDLLGVEYVKALLRQHAGLEPVAVRREDAGHDGGRQGETASASYIRSHVLAGESGWPCVPEPAAEICRRETDAGRGPVSPAAAEQMILARLRTMTAADYEALPAGGEGLADRLEKAGRTQPTVQAVLDSVKTKRYAMSRIRRLLLYALLGIQADDLCGLPPYLRVLAFNRTGRMLLADMRKKAALPVITKPAAGLRLGGRAEKVLRTEAQADDLYALCFPDPAQRTGGSLWRTSPVCLE